MLAATGCTPLIDPRGRGRDPVRYRRRIVGDRAVSARPMASPARAARARHARLGVAAGRRRDACRAPWRHQGDAARFSRPWSPRCGGHIAPSRAQHADHSPQRMHLLGTSGTVTTIAGVHLGLKRYDRRRVDGCWMIGRGSHRGDGAAARDVLRRARRQCLYRRRARRPRARRLRHPGSDPPRVSVCAAARRRPRVCAKACWCR